MISILSLASAYCYLKISESSEFPWKKVKVGRKKVNFKCTFFQIGTVAFKVSMQYCTASREFILWADETAIITLASPMGTTLQKHCYLWSTVHQTVSELHSDIKIEQWGALMVDALDSWSTRLVSTLDHTNGNNWVRWPASQAIVLFV